MSFRARRFASGQAARPFSWGDEAERLAADIQPPPPAAEAAREPAAQASSDHSLATIEREAFANGYAQGERAGFEAGAHRAEAMLRRLAGTIDELTTVRRAMINQTERQLVQLALAVARRIVQR